MISNRGNSIKEALNYSWLAWILDKNWKNRSKMQVNRVRGSTNLALI